VPAVIKTALSVGAIVSTPRAPADEGLQAQAKG
jgi:hypothetical protein